MSTRLEIAEVRAASPGFPDLVALFQGYRRHYGQSAEDAAEVQDWLGSQLAGGGLRGFLAHRHGEPGGMALVAPTPASVRLGHFWQLRDLYVMDHHRRAGIGRALLVHVRDVAAAEGALRLALTTEADNTGALALYRELGFEPVDGYTSMSLTTEISG
ncbi:GNAT family N-acetyltransferase [Nocardioides sp.]|uniref:GNAT family N-acetyltransferase n=1 Tax=Nocardioides sp. TaxID=35761 RepID=UPI00286AE3F0|nr:GNAT family N-acetyltransferase [Nocardioides sp.]